MPKTLAAGVLEPTNLASLCPDCAPLLRHPLFTPQWHRGWMVERDVDDLADFLIARANDPGVGHDRLTTTRGTVAAYRDGKATAQAED
jgi:hypothetical protein